MGKPDDNYWDDYDGLQHAKHQLLRRYLGGWFPILTSWQGQVLYIDCNAGRGRHSAGQEGSPLLALDLLLNHTMRHRILSSAHVHFVFFEINKTNYRKLKSEIAALGSLPPQMHTQVVQDDYEASLLKDIAELKANRQQLAPSFAFVDPYGFRLSMDFLNSLMQFSSCELLINFMYRYVDMAIHNNSQESNMNALFGCHTWKDLRKIRNPQKRAESTIALFSKQLNAKYVTHMYMRGTNKALKYVLIHATNHERGRKLMKEAMWSVKSDGSFTAYERDVPDQQILIQAEPDLSALEDALWTQFAGRSMPMKQIYEWLLTQTYLEKHLHQTLLHYRKNGAITATGYEGRFAYNKNPTIHFPRERPESE